jgi:hypothetical protein
VTIEELRDHIGVREGILMIGSQLTLRDKVMDPGARLEDYIPRDAVGGSQPRIEIYVSAILRG